MIDMVYYAIVILGFAITLIVANEIWSRKK